MARHIVVESARADVVVGAGDFAICGVGAHETLTILRDCDAPLVIVHGNHDEPEELRTTCAGWQSGHYLHGTFITLADVPFFGLGGEVPSRSDEPWNRSESEAAAAELLDLCPRGAVLVTHTPPFGLADVQADRTHHGSTAIREAIRSRAPLLNLCGHIHHSWGVTGRIDHTRVHNLGPAITWFEV